MKKLSQDPESVTNSQTDAQSANHKSPPTKPVGDNKRKLYDTHCTLHNAGSSQ
ncbi:hypothetical protein DPMN_121108 [Dreissena polymorpha]|uniref:Uncharacterized protein n=1 Tax=Dreissena polymorpha TaxID=45954 RepID=A0A9D4GQ71_DREPO|nr:hypothetical protein DPMN_121108 [Dreissena polymorpha]